MLPRKGNTLAGHRVLVVEDEMLVSLLIEEVLDAEQCTVVGPFDKVGAALDAARTEPIDAAILDVNVAGALVYPVAEELARRGIPFVLLTGYGHSGLPNEHPDWTVCSKPFRPTELVKLLMKQIKRG